MLFRPTVAPARPCRVPSDVREFMAPALELAVVPAGRKGREENKKRSGKRGRELLFTGQNSQGSSSCRGFLLKRS